MKELDRSPDRATRATQNYIYSLHRLSIHASEGYGPNRMSVEGGVRSRGASAPSSSRRARRVSALVPQGRSNIGRRVSARVPDGTLEASAARERRVSRSPRESSPDRDDRGVDVTSAVPAGTWHMGAAGDPALTRRASLERPCGTRALTRRPVLSRDEGAGAPRGAPSTTLLLGHDLRRRLAGTC